MQESTDAVIFHTENRRYCYLHLDQRTPSIGLAGTGNGDILSFTANNTGLAPVVATIVVTPHFENGGTTCDGPAKTFTITVNPTAHVEQPVSQVVCNNESTTAVIFHTETPMVLLPTPGPTNTIDRTCRQMGQWRHTVLHGDQYRSCPCCCNDSCNASF